MKPLYLLPALLGLLSSCQKQPIDTLPKATQEGRQTGGCLVDGKAFIAAAYTSGSVSVPAVDASLASYDSSLVLHLTTADARGLTLLLRHVRGPGEYELASNTSYYPAAPVSLCRNQGYLNTPGSSPNQPGFYGTSAAHVGRVRLTTVNWAQHVVAGTFDFEGFDANSGQTVRVTDGRFDVRYP